MANAMRKLLHTKDQKIAEYTEVLDPRRSTLRCCFLFER